MTQGNHPQNNTAERKQCDLLITNAFVITMDDRRRMIRNGAVAVTGDRIAFIGSTEEACHRYEGKTLDAKGGVGASGPHRRAMSMCVSI